MLTSEQWNSLLYLKPSDFQHPDGMQFSVVSALDQFIGRIGVKPQLLSDYRAGDLRQHGKGLAVDTYWPGQDPAAINQAAINSQLFSGIGVYVNEGGVASHHFDTRLERSLSNPATWGGIITHPLNPDTNQVQEAINYVGMADVLDLIKKNAGGATNVVLMALIVIGAYLILRNIGGHS